MKKKKKQKQKPKNKIKFDKVPDSEKVERFRKPPESMWKDTAIAILELEPPEGIIIAIPFGVEPEQFRQRVRRMVDTRVKIHSSFTYEVSVAVNRRVLVSCKP